jgi:predicted dehydrogenase
LIGPIARVIGVTRTFAPCRSGRDGSPVAADVEDAAFFLAEFAEGVGVEQGTVATFDLSKVAKGRERGGNGLDEFEVYGTQGTLIYHLHRPHEIMKGRPDGILETFYDGMRCQAVIDAVLQSARERRWVEVADIPPVTVPLTATRHCAGKQKQ